MSGVSPIDVSTDFPPSIAHIDEPWPIWQVIIFKSSIFSFIISAALFATNLWLVPWKPYFLVKGKEKCISKEESKVKVYVIPTNEELMIARDTHNLVK